MAEETIIDIEPEQTRVQTQAPVNGSPMRWNRPLIPPGLIVGLSLGIVAGVLLVMYTTRRRDGY